MKIEWGHGNQLELHISRDEYRVLREIVEARKTKLAKADMITPEAQRDKSILSLIVLGFMDAKKDMGIET